MATIYRSCSITYKRLMTIFRTRLNCLHVACDSIPSVLTCLPLANAKISHMLHCIIVGNATILSTLSYTQYLQSVSLCIDIYTMTFASFPNRPGAQGNLSRYAIVVASSSHGAVNFRYAYIYIEQYTQQRDKILQIWISISLFELSIRCPSSL